VICEKPLTGYFGADTDEKPVGLHVSREKMRREVKKELREIQSAAERSGKLFMYAENWIYTPSVQKTAEFLRAKASKLLFLKGEESHSGSHAGHAAHWSQNGGGSLIRQGCHPLSTILYLKSVEAQVRGEEIYVESVTADTACISNLLNKHDRRHIASHPVDVEDWACVSIEFSDGTRAVVLSGDMVLGGVLNYIEAYSSDGVLRNNISPNDALESYFVEEDGLEDVYITEKVQNKTGWQKVFLSESYTRGYVGELQDFVECVRDSRQPISGLDLAAQTAEVIYAAYQSAYEKRAVRLER
jgi:predicted dehydrogenase